MIFILNSACNGNMVLPESCFFDPGTVPHDWRPPIEEDFILQSNFFPNRHYASDVRDAAVDTGTRHCARCQNCCHQLMLAQDAILIFS
jgi:hypothetical protein